ncbi:MAG: MBL fold metallo-hydrolase [Chloroflexi bacterium RBG_13_56_8]|nr:MAG: MBL fold metallo-hydrolase [Chloroflexi bacterium RBG_13_56_8]
MEIQFLGAVRNVTGSMHLLIVNGSRILLECGLFQGHRQESFDRNRNLPFDAATIDAMVLSHAHIDHSGNIPNLVRSGFRSNIHSTFATRDLCSIMLRDAAHIMEGDVEYLNKKRRHKRLPPLEPTYTVEDATRSLQYFVSMDYGRSTLIAPGVKLTFADAGHILGSAFCVLDIAENGREYRILFTGDVGRIDLPILRDPQVVHDVDYLITESTYGARLHGTPQEAEQELKRVVNQTYERGGKVIIPAFSVGRTQEIVYALHRLQRDKEIPSLPTFVDSPLSINATEVFRLHPEYYDSETYAFMLETGDPFGFGALHYVQSVEDSKALNTREEPMIIISASGMCEAGRILHHLKNNIEDSRNTVLLVSFQAENTLGRRIQERREQVSIFGERYTLRAHIESIDGYSAHADKNELLSYFQRLQPQNLRGAFIVHGDEEASSALEEGLRGLGVRKTKVPTLGEKVTI